MLLEDTCTPSVGSAGAGTAGAGFAELPSTFLGDWARAYGGDLIITPASAVAAQRGLPGT